MVETEVEKEEVESDKTEKPPDSTREKVKEMFGFTNPSMHHSDGDDVADFCFFQLGTHTDEVPMINPTTSGEDENYEVTTSVVDDNRMNMGMKFANIVCGNQSLKSVRGLTL